VVFIGWRPALRVSVAIPTCYYASLGIDMLFAHTINRITLFPLILSLGLQLDNPVVGIDNIERFICVGSSHDNHRIRFA
jgi:multidrug efflux pump subunit AcrB